MFKQDFTDPALLSIINKNAHIRDLLPSLVRKFCTFIKSIILGLNPRSLTTTYGISVDLFSFSYLDVSVR